MVHPSFVSVATESHSPQMRGGSGSGVASGHAGHAEHD